MDASSGVPIRLDTQAREKLRLRIPPVIPHSLTLVPLTIRLFECVHRLDWTCHTGSDKLAHCGLVVKLFIPGSVFLPVTV